MADYNAKPSPWTRFFRLLRVDRRDVFYIYLYASLTGLITLSLPLGIQAIIGLMAGGELSTSLLILIAVVTLGTAFTGFLTILQLKVSERIQRRLFTRSSFEFGYRIPRLQEVHFSREYAPELVNRFFDTLTLQKGIPKILMDLSSSLLQIVFGLILISFYHPLFAVFGFFLAIIVFLILRLTGPSGLKTSLAESDYKYKVVYWLEEIARTLLTFKLSGNPRLTLDRTDTLVSGYLEARRNHFRILVTQYGSIVGFKAVVTGTLLLLGSWLAVTAQINIGQFVAAEIVIILILNSVEKVIVNMDTIYDVLTGLEKIGKVTDLSLDRQDGFPYSSIKTGKGMEVALEQVSFQFPDADSPTLQDITLSIQPGEKICIAGFNGSGKATLVRLVSGLYTDFRGGMSYNNVPFQNINLESLRSGIGDYNEHGDIFRGTIAQNICLREKHPSLKDMQEAAEAVGLLPFIKSRPKGFDTELTPGGRNIPKSIRAKILLARCIIANPDLLALEEFLSSFVSEDRERIIDYLLNNNHCWTMLAISNDYDFASRCDRVIVMHKGKILLQGTPQEVLEDSLIQSVFTKPHEEPASVPLNQ